MDKKIAGLLGAVAALGTLNAAFRQRRHRRTVDVVTGEFVRRSAAADPERQGAVAGDR